MFDSFSFFPLIFFFFFLCSTSISSVYSESYFHFIFISNAPLPGHPLQPLSCSVSRFLCTSRLKGFRAILLSSCRGKVFTHILWYCSAWQSRMSGRYGSRTRKFPNEYSCGRSNSLKFSIFPDKLERKSIHIFVFVHAHACRVKDTRERIIRQFE